MNKLINYVLYIYTTFIIPNREEISIYKDSFKPIMSIMTEWLNVYIWVCAIIFFPYFMGCIFIDFLKKTDRYKNIMSVVKINY